MGAIGQPPDLTPEQQADLERWLLEQAGSERIDAVLDRCAPIPEGCEEIALPRMELSARMSTIYDMDLSRRPDGWTLEEWGGYVGLQWQVAEQSIRSLFAELRGLRATVQENLIVAGSPSAAAYFEDVLSLIDLRLGVMECELRVFQNLRCGVFVIVLEAPTGRTYLARREDVERATGVPTEIRQFDYQGIGVDPLTWILVGGIFVVISVASIGGAYMVAEIYAAKNADARTREVVVRSFAEAAEADERAAREARARGDESTAQHLETRAAESRRAGAETALEGEQRRGASETAEAEAEAGTGIKDILVWGLVALFILKGMEHL